MPPSASTPSTPTTVTPMLMPRSACSLQTPTSSYDCGRATPPGTTTLTLGRIASSAAMLSALVTTVRLSRTVSWRATSVVVLPPVRPTTAPSGMRVTAIRAIARFCSRCWLVR